MVSFFFQDYRFGGPHNQIKRYMEALPKKHSKEIILIKPKSKNLEIGLINLKKISKYLYPIEIVMNVFYILLKKKFFFKKNTISCTIGVYNISPIISSAILNKKSFWFIVEDVNRFSFFLLKVIKFLFSPEIILIDKFLKKKININNCKILPPYLRKKKVIKKIKNFSLMPELLSVGNINTAKGYDFLLQEIFNNKIKCKLNILGKKLSTQIALNKKINFYKKKLKIEGICEVNFLGFKNENYIKKIILNSDLFILPSYTEGCPNALLEAMSLGSIVLASNVGAIPNIIKHQKNGYLFDHNKGDFFKVYNKILNTSSLDLKKVSKMAKKTISEKFANKKKFIKNYENIFLSCSL